MKASPLRLRAQALKEQYDGLRERDPAMANSTAAELRELAGTVTDPGVRALAVWTDGLAALQLDGHPERALDLLDQAVSAYAALGEPQAAAAVQVARIHALALLGRYDEALACADSASAVLLAAGNQMSAAKIEQNVGNIRFRREQYHEAEVAYRRARDGFLAVGDRQQLVQIDTCLAAALKWENNFREAGTLYEEALAVAQQEGLHILEGEIACNLGCLELDQGRYAPALGHLEHSRRRFAELDLEANATRVEQELASAYLELNLAPEAAELAERVAGAEARRGLHAEQARALVCLAQARLLLGDFDEASAALTEAGALYLGEGNEVGQSLVRLLDAQRAFAQGEFAIAVDQASSTLVTFQAAGAWGRLLLAKWHIGEALRAQGCNSEAREVLEALLRDADAGGIPALIQRTLTSLGMLARAEGRRDEARQALSAAVDLAESLRAPLPAEEFRTAFFADRLAPYTELTRLSLEDGTPGGVDDAFRYAEAARSRTLWDALTGAPTPRRDERDSFESALVERIEQLREELNWYYSRLGDTAGVHTNIQTMQALHAAVRERETSVLEIQRQLANYGGDSGRGTEELRIDLLQTALGCDSVFVEYLSVDDEILAFVVSEKGVQVVRRLCSRQLLEAAVAQFRFQVESVGIGGADSLNQHLEQLTQRCRRHLATLYDLVLRPLQNLLGERRLVIAPHRSLHYVPFHALFDGQAYVVESREVVVVPSARVLLHCLGQRRRPIERAVLVGVPDERAPRVRDEVLALEGLFPHAITLLDKQATLSALQTYAPTADLVHLACHGQFRPDNPLFSSLRLGDEWLTVRDIYDLHLDGALVTLSACETGVSAVAPGDELIGLARGFFAAGAQALLVSLWTVDDAATAELMASVYRRLQAGDRPARALRAAQLQQLQAWPHPYFWSPFVLLGRW